MRTTYKPEIDALILQLRERGLRWDLITDRINDEIARGRLPGPELTEVQVRNRYRRIRPSEQPARSIIATLRQALRGVPKSLADLSSATGSSPDEVRAALRDLEQQGVAVRLQGGLYYIDTAPPPAYLEQGGALVMRSRPDGTYLFGVLGDTHIGSKYYRDDVHRDLYEKFAEAGVDAVFHCGNWIDGDAGFNRHDVVVSGIDRQCQLMAELHPRIEGVTTYAVWGDDHEGWYAQREGIDVGRYAETIMRQHGHLWTDLGFMESHVRLVDSRSGKENIMAVVHPGGGSAYAISYSIQKIIESLEGGEKPGVGLYGHYHKLWSANIRNVWVAQVGCTQDQTPFMRKKKLEAHVGGMIVRLSQDPATGAIIRFQVDTLRYFNRDYYEHSNSRWSKHGNVTRPPRTLAGV